nr:hypothetical protein [Hymenobacter sp. APR13]
MGPENSITIHKLIARDKVIHIIEILDGEDLQPFYVCRWHGRAKYARENLCQSFFQPLLAVFPIRQDCSEAAVEASGVVGFDKAETLAEAAGAFDALASQPASSEG